jgi:hypothetical protein
MRSICQRRCWGAALSFAVAGGLVLAVSHGSAKAQAVGSVGAVTPRSVGTPRGANTRTLILGARVIADERIQTSGEGTTNIIFLDRTTLSIGRNSILIIDKYVYDPSSGRGALTATMARGVLRFIGGQISHSSGAQVLTPVATIGVRGGMMTVRVGPDGTTVMSHYGHIDVGNGRNHQFLLRSGFFVHVGGRDAFIAPPQQTSEQALNEDYMLLNNNTYHHRYRGLDEATAAEYGLGADRLPNDPDSMPGLDTVGLVNLGQTFVGNRSQQQQWNGARPPRNNYWPSSNVP